MRGLIAALSVAVGLACPPAAADDPEPEEAVPGGPAPAFSVQHPDGYWQAWTDFLGEAGLLIVFATTGTARELSALDVSEGSALPALIIDTTCGGDPEEARDAYPAVNDTLSLRFDPRGEVARLYSVPAVPFAVAVDRDRVIVFMGGLGRTADETTAVRDAFAAIAGGQAPDLSRAPAGSATRFRPYCLPDSTPP